MPEVTIRPERASDAAAIRALLTGAFPTPAEADLVEALRADGDAALALVAEAGDGLAGHVLFSPMAAPFRALGLAPVAVAAEARRQGIAERLIRAGLDGAARAGWQGVFVLGEPAYYARFGFSPDLAQSFTSAFAGPHLMALGLGPGPLPASRGRICFAPAFRRVFGAG